MAERLKTILAVFARGLGFVLLALLALATFAYSSGVVRVYVLEKKPGGDRINLFVPAILVPVALKFMPAEDRRRTASELGPYLPALKAATEELARCPDAVLVQVEGPREHVSIRKLGRSLVIDVDSSDEIVHVSFPLKMVTSILAEFEDATPLAARRAALQPE